MPTLERFSHEALRHTVITFRDAMKAHAPGINKLNVYPVPDGDTGTNMARTLDAVVAELDGAELGMDSTCDAISHGSLMGARGNSGVILKIGQRIETGVPGRLVFGDVPANLRDRPTLVMQIANNGAAQQDVELSYLTSGLSWKADYVVELNDK